jgi:tetratricopeptide (TPR) repeat protein
VSSPATVTIKRLFAVSGNQCAFPDCSLPLVDSVSGTVLGEICHIKARSPDGPRYDPAQTERARHAFENLLLLCPAHHKVVDGDPDKYTVEKLKQIKEQHESDEVGGVELTDDAARQMAVQLEIRGNVSGMVAIGSHIVQIRADVINIMPPNLQREPLPPYIPPTPLDPDILPDPGPLPPGSRVIFGRNHLFTGRDEFLKKLARALLHGGSSSALVAQVVQGMGGIGKTQLAVEFAYRYGRFFYGVHKIDATRPDTIGAEVAACGEVMGTQNWPTEQPEKIAHTIREWQSNGARLVILDNLEDIAAAREWLARLGGGPVRLLITTRRSGWPSDLGLRPLTLKVFTPTESREFLRRYLPGERAVDADLGRLAGRLGHLPLALELAGRYLQRNPSLALTAYQADLEEIWDHPSMARFRKDLGGPTDNLDLAASFAVSWQQVTDEMTRRLFLLAGYCAPGHSIPRELLEQALLAQPTRGFWRLIKLWKRKKRPSPMDYDQALDVLTGLGLLGVQKDHRADPIIHPLLAEYARHQVRKKNHILSALADTLGSLALQANKKDLPADFIPLRAHLEIVAPAAEAAKLQCAGKLWNDLGYHLYRVADYCGAQTAFKHALALDERCYGRRHPIVAIRLNNLGNVLQAVGILGEAKAAFERAQDINEQAYGLDHLSVATTINNLGSVLQDLGDLQGAREAFEDALKITTRRLGPDDPKVATTYNNLGDVLRALGDLQGARRAFERAQDINERTYGPAHFSVATNVNNLGMVLRDQGDLEGAREAFARALTVFEQTRGPKHSNVAIATSNLGSVLQVQGDLQGAQEAFKRALTIDEQLYGTDHPKTAVCLNSLGEVLRDRGNLKDARAVFARARAIIRDRLGPGDPNIAILDRNIAHVSEELQGTNETSTALDNGPKTTEKPQ